jgi:hypothetical protein
MIVTTHSDQFAPHHALYRISSRTAERKNNNTMAVIQYPEYTPMVAIQLELLTETSRQAWSKSTRVFRYYRKCTIRPSITEACGTM